MKLTIKTADDLAAEQAARAAQAAQRPDAMAYLASTDWLVVRQAETGKPVPQDARDRRAEARAILDGSAPPAHVRDRW